MKLPAQFDLPVKIPNEVLRALSYLWTRLSQVINSVSFGTPQIGQQNIDGVWATVTTPGVADTEFTITHNLGRLPAGFLVFSLDKAAIVYKGATPWTNTQIFLKTNQATVKAVLFIT